MARCYHRPCGRTFAGLSGFDHHLRWLRRDPWVECVDPADRGMTIQDGVWFKQAPSLAGSGKSPG